MSFPPSDLPPKGLRQQRFRQERFPQDGFPRRLFPRTVHGEQMLATFEGGPLTFTPAYRDLDDQAETGERSASDDRHPFYRGGLRRAMETLVGRTARGLIATNRRLVVDYGRRESLTVHYAPGSEVRLFRPSPKFPIRTLLLRACVLLLALVMLSGGLPYSVLGLILIALVTLMFLGDYLLSGLEVLTPDPAGSGTYRITTVYVLAGGGRNRLRQFVEDLNAALAVNTSSLDAASHRGPQ